jgi:hypothetical protein
MMRTVDVIGIVMDDHGTKEINTKTGAIRKVRGFTIVDDSKVDDLDHNTAVGIDINIWGDNVDQIKLEEKEVVALKRCRTNDYRGSIRLNASEDDGIYHRGELKVIKDCFRIYNWFKKVTSNLYNF